MNFGAVNLNAKPLSKSREPYTASNLTIGASELCHGDRTLGSVHDQTDLVRNNTRVSVKQETTIVTF